MIQILGRRPVVVWPKDAGPEQKLVLPAAEAADPASRDRASRGRPVPLRVAADGPHARSPRASLSGLLFGGVYSLMAVGLTLIFGVMRVVNFAHGDMMVWGMYLAWLLATRLGVDPYLGFVARRAARALRARRRSSSGGSSTASSTRPHEMQILLLLGVGARARERGAGGVRARTPARAGRR